MKQRARDASLLCPGHASIDPVPGWDDNGTRSGKPKKPLRARGERGTNGKDQMYRVSATHDALRHRMPEHGVGFEIHSSVQYKCGSRLIDTHERLRLDRGEFSLEMLPSRSAALRIRVPLNQGIDDMRPRLLLADDHALLIEGIRLMLEPEFELVGSVEDGLSLLAAAKTLKPDIILLDISMPELNGIDAAHGLRKLLPSTKLIFLTMHADADYVAEAFQAGAMGYILKCAAASELKIAIREVLKGYHHVSPHVARNALELLISSVKPEGKGSDRLTPRQREVIQLVAEGRSRKEIASVLNISIKTVEFHKATLARELNLHSIADFTRYAIEYRIIPERSQ